MIDEELSKLYHYMSTWVDIYNKNINENVWLENEYDGMFYLLTKDKRGDWRCENAGMVNLKDEVYNYKQGLNETGTKFFMHFDTFDKNELKKQVDRQVKQFKQILKMEHIENDFV